MAKTKKRQSKKREQAQEQEQEVRLIERDYFAALADKLTLTRWGKVVNRALSDAEKGDARAREWVSKHALGAVPMSLFDLADREYKGIESRHEVEAKAEQDDERDPLLRGALDRAWVIATKERGGNTDEQEKASDEDASDDASGE